MKNMFFMVVTLLAIAPPALGMDLDQERATRTITVIADLDKTKSLQVYQKPIGRCAPGEFYDPPQGYVYDYENHRFSFPVPIKELPRYAFSVSYIPFRTGFDFEELTYTHDFEIEVPAGDNDGSVQATLLSIERDGPVQYGEPSKRKVEQIYKKK
jgi:hypothetical protein